MRVPTLLLTGPVGVGKSTVLYEMSSLLAAADIRHASVDFDALTECHPLPADDDRWGTRIGMSNLAAIWRNYAAAGIDRLLIARVIEDRAELAGYARAVPGAEITIVRLRASRPTLRQRIRRRGQPAGLQWHLDRAVELAEKMELQPVEDFVVDTDGRGPTDVAGEILLSAKWLSARRPQRGGGRPSRARVRRGSASASAKSGAIGRQ